MKRLVRILLVNWYRIEQLSIDIEGHTAIIGPNASGKSSLLDAVQAVLVGGDKNWWSPNASAGEKSTRTLRDYCLGVVREGDDIDISMDLRARDHALTYVALVFRDDTNGESVSLGLAMHARREEQQEHIDGRFIAQGVELNLSDFVDHLASGTVPKPWKRIHSELLKRCGARFQSFPQSGLFQRNLYAVLSGGSRHIDQTRFLRAFKNAVTFLPIRNVSDFIRKYILEERPIHVKELQQALQRYRDIRKRTKDAEEREKQLKVIDELYQRAEKAERLAIIWQWVEQEALYNALMAEMEPLQEVMEVRERTIVQLKADLESLEDAWKKADDAHNERSKKLAATDTAQRKLAIAAERRATEAGRGVIEEKLKRTRSDLKRVYHILDHASLLDDIPLQEKLQALPALLDPKEDMLTRPWPPDPAKVVTCINDLKPDLIKVQSQAKERHEAMIREVGRLSDLLTDMQERINRLERGESDLSRETRALQKLLTDNGIESEPLCDLVDVKDEAWRAALETFLGGHREALLVAPEQVRDAITLYRRRGRELNIHGSRIINTLKTADWRDRCEAGSLAEWVVSENEHAIAYINRQAGRVICVDAEKELLQHERAISRDLMLATSGAVLRMQPVEPLLGRAAIAQRLTLIKDQFNNDGQTYYQKNNNKNNFDKFRETSLDPFVQAVLNLSDLSSLCQQRQQLDEILAQLNTEEAALSDDKKHKQLEQEVNALYQQRTAIKITRDEKQEQCHQQELEQKTVENILLQRDIELKKVQESRRQVTKKPGFDYERAATHLAELEESELFSEGDVAAWKSLANEAVNRAERQQSAMRKSRDNARTQVQDYIARTRMEDTPALSLDDDHQPLAAWTIRTLTDLQETQLAQYVIEAENALREAEHAFRADFIGKLQDNLHYLEEQRRELNRNLRNRPFHGQYYHFTREAERDLQPILKWVESWSPEEGGQVGTLFDTSSDPNHPHREAIERVKTLFMETGDPNSKTTDDWNSRLADYRQYFHFDVRMTDDADGKGNPELLSRRLGKGSGGEHQSPFYVAIGAALAAAYRIEREKDGGRRGGLCLAMFDEAFSKLDVQNAANALHFLDDLGLQVLLAAPDEKYGQIAEHIDTIINVYRDGGIVHVEAEYIKPAAQGLLAADNPLRVAVADE